MLSLGILSIAVKAERVKQEGYFSQYELYYPMVFKVIQARASTQRKMNCSGRKKKDILQICEQ